MKKGQMEMVGLVFIVIIAVLGIFIYLQVATRAPNVDSTVSQEATSFLIAFKETTIPSCGASVEQVAAACIEKKGFCSSGDPCFELQQALEDIVESTLVKQGIKFNLSVEGTGVMFTESCDSANYAVSLAAAPRAPIILSSGVTKNNIVLSICR